MIYSQGYKLIHSFPDICRSSLPIESHHKIMITEFNPPTKDISRYSPGGLGLYGLFMDLLKQYSGMYRTYQGGVLHQYVTFAGYILYHEGYFKV